MAKDFYDSYFIFWIASLLPIFERENIAEKIMKIDYVHEFNLRFGIPESEVPTLLDRKMMDQRLAFLQEELDGCSKRPMARQHPMRMSTPTDRERISTRRQPDKPHPRNWHALKAIPMWSPQPTQLIV